MTSRCHGCNGQTRCVPPDGPSPAIALLIGERPGYWEDNVFNRPFTGDSGRELNDNYLLLAGLTRDDVRITNTVRCRSYDTNRKPTAKEVESCASHFIPAEVRACEPQVIVLMGGTACSMVGDPKIDLDTEHGIPRWVEKCEYFGDWSGWVLPMFHPAAGMHNTSLMIPLLEDWKNFGDWLKGNWRRPEPLSSLTIKQRLRTSQEVLLAMCFGKTYDFLPVDTESDEGRPFSVQFSPNPEYGYMILSEDHEALKTFWRAFSSTWGKRMAMHFALHDLDELERHYGWSGIEVVDMMIDAYHLGNLPQGLKALTYRLTGVRMTSYQDVVVPASEEALSNWLADATALVTTEWKMQRVVKKQPKTFAAKGLVKYESFKHPAEAVLRRVLRHIGKNEEESGTDEKRYDPWQEPKKLGTDDEEIRLIGRDWLEAVEAKVGRMPRKSIIHASLPKAIEYGCSDAIYTGHCMIRLQERRKWQQQAWTVAEEDKDKGVSE